MGIVLISNIPTKENRHNWYAWLIIYIRPVEDLRVFICAIKRGIRKVIVRFHNPF